MKQPYYRVAYEIPPSSAVYYAHYDFNVWDEQQAREAFLAQFPQWKIRAVTVVQWVTARKGNKE